MMEAGELLGVSERQFRRYRSDYLAIVEVDGVMAAGVAERIAVGAAIN
jgi:hypothetical protein